MYVAEVSCYDGRFYNIKYWRNDIDYVLKDVRDWISKVDWTIVEDIIIREVDE